MLPPEFKITSRSLTSIPRGTITHVIGALVAGGAERFVVSLLCALKKQGLNVHLLTLSNRCDGTTSSMMKSLVDSGISIGIGPTPKVGVRSVAWYRGKMIVDAPGVVHLHTANTELAHFLATRGLRSRFPVVRTLHSTGYSGGRVGLVAMRKNSAAVSIGCSKAVRVAWEERIEDQIHYITNGIDFSWPVQTSEERTKCRVLLGLDLKRTHYLAVGRMDGSTMQASPKGHDTLIRAWKFGRLAESNCQLNLVGDGNLRNELESLSGADTSIVFHGLRPDVSKWLLAADCFVMPSRWEGMPLAGIEAIGTGINCIFSDIEPLRELSPPMAFWFPVDDYRSLAGAMTRSLSSKMQTEEQHILRVRANFGIENVAMKYAEIYSQLG